MLKRNYYIDFNGILYSAKTFAFEATIAVDPNTLVHYLEDCNNANLKCLGEVEELPGISIPNLELYIYKDKSNKVVIDLMKSNEVLYSETVLY